MALVHDLAECIVGDITPSDGIDKEKKHQMELVSHSPLCSWCALQCTRAQTLECRGHYQTQAMLPEDGLHMS